MRCRSRRHFIGGLHFLGQVGADVLGHPEAAHLVGAEDLGHLLVGDEVLLVVGILKSESRKRSAPDLLRPSGIKSRANGT